MDKWEIAVNKQIETNTMLVCNRDKYPDFVEMPDRLPQFLIVVGTKQDADWLDKRREKLYRMLQHLNDIEPLALQFQLYKMEEISVRGFPDEFLAAMKTFELQLQKAAKENTEKFDPIWEDRQNAPSTRTLQ